MAEEVQLADASKHDTDVRTLELWIVYGIGDT
jgi:hypothetical protein